MTEQDILDEGSELPGLRELHRQDRMPEDVRERLMRRMRMPSAGAHADTGLRQVGLDVGPGINPDTNPYTGGDTGPDLGLDRNPGLGRGRDRGVDGAPRLAGPRWAPSLVEDAERKPGAHRRRLGWGLGAAALVAAGMALFIGAPALRFGVEPRQAASDTPISSESTGGASSPDRTAPDELRVVGWLEQGSLQRLAIPSTEARGACRFGFRLRPLTVDSNAVLRIEYPRCRIPETLTSANGGCVKVTAEGHLAADGHLEAKRVVAQFVQCQP